MDAMPSVLKSSIPYKGPVSQNLIEFMRIGLRKNSRQTILIDSVSGRSWTGKEMEAAMSRIARYLIDDCGLKKGDVCLIKGPPDDRMVLLVLSVMAAGGVHIFQTPKYRPNETLNVCEFTGVKFLISTKELLSKLHPNFGNLPIKVQVISCDDICDGFKNGCKQIGHLLVKDSTAPSYSCEELIGMTNIDDEHDFAVIQFSSGTTGKPKPIPRTHKNLCHLVASVDHEEMMDLKPGEVITGNLPITHRPGLWAVLACINSGSTIVLWANLADVQEALQTVEKYRATIFSTSLPFLAMLGNVGIKSKERYDLSSLKHIITSGAKIVNEDLPKLVVKEFNLVSLRQCFGMTETGWCFLIELSVGKKGFYQTVGHVCPGSEAIIINRETGEPVGKGVKGEVALRGPQVFPGYLTDREGVYNRDDFTHDGWFKTGDEGYFDSSEFVYIEGRYKEMMTFSNNQRSFPNEIEALISEHPAVEGVCVVKVGEFRQQILYDLARAYVTLKHGCELNEKDLLDFVTERSNVIMLEGGIRFLDKFPRMENGKVDKQVLKDMK